jgi:hypothetical protein
VLGPVATGSGAALETALDLLLDRLRGASAT